MTATIPTMKTATVIYTPAKLQKLYVAAEIWLAEYSAYLKAEQARIADANLSAGERVERTREAERIAAVMARPNPADSI